MSGASSRRDTGGGANPVDIRCERAEKVSASIKFDIEVAAAPWFITENVSSDP